MASFEKPSYANGAAIQHQPNGKSQVHKNEQLSYVDTAIQRTSTTVNWAASKAKDTLDKVVPPEQSNAIVERARDFASANPKLAAFLLTNLAFSAVPVLLFTVFSVSVFIFSLLTGLIMGIVAALVFTSSVVGLALVFLVPTILMTTLAATTLFFWTVVGLYVYTQVERRNQRQLKA
ncbi:hypothetical protein AMS68_005353 [Peltaster fructicola]|uniref:Uncharacterized protein n=1 Tax=Peltaster fructicola TaxID=286661 RepID=A0A6H0XYS7_9PEZI|nr:hypothetical protein AMS68_005353 [Peltaster fructicola]